MRKPIVDLAIIIPTLNEEFYIGKLLDSIELQSISPKEIIVVDANSADGTIKEIKKRQKTLPQLKFIKIPKYSIGRQRNLGVKKTTAKKLLFIDADMFFANPFALEKLFYEAHQRNADFAIPKILFSSEKAVDQFLCFLHNGIPKAVKPFKAAATTQCLFVKRAIFKRANGFDEEIKVAEDFDLVSRMQKIGGRFIILKNSTILSSVRRLEKDGRVRYVGLLGISLLMITLIGYKNNPVQKKYDFGNHPKLN